MSNFDKWMGRLKFIKGEYPFTDGEVIEVRNDDGRLHCDYGPAYRSRTRCTWYSNGRIHGMDVDIFGSLVYFYNGVRIPRKFFVSPEEITFQEIMTQPNAEVRRVGCEIYGFSRMIDEGHLKLLDRDNDTSAELYKIDIPSLVSKASEEDEPIVLVKVLDGTEVDGQRRVYFLKVPPDMTNCKKAIAWTFYKEEKQYKPLVET